MLNFSFYNPTNIVFGENQLQELDNLVPKKRKCPYHIRWRQR